jgi:hypothetical protein
MQAHYLSGIIFIKEFTMLSNDGLLFSAMDFCQKAVDYPGPWHERSDMLYEFKKVYTSFWRSYIHDEQVPLYNTISKNFGQACSSLKAFGTYKESDNITLMNVLAWELTVQEERLKSLKDWYEECGEAGKTLAHNELFFVHPFTKWFCDLLRKDAATDIEKELCDVIDRINDGMNALLKDADPLREIAALEKEIRKVREEMLSAG